MPMVRENGGHYDLDIIIVSSADHSDLVVVSLVANLYFNILLQLVYRIHWNSQ